MSRPATASQIPPPASPEEWDARRPHTRGELREREFLSIGYASPPARSMDDVPWNSSTNTWRLGSSCPSKVRRPWQEADDEEAVAPPPRRRAGGRGAASCDSRRRPGSGPPRRRRPWGHHRPSAGSSRRRRWKGAPLSTAFLPGPFVYRVDGDIACRVVAYIGPGSG